MKQVLLGLCLVAAAGCGANGQGTPVSRAAATGSGGWIALSSLDQWRGFKRPDLPGAWQIQDGALALVPVADRAQRGDIITREQFSDFEMELEWKIAEGGNSGIMYRVGEDGAQTYSTGPEMQVLDDARHADGKIPSHRAGALYDLIVPPENIARPVGEWNRARIIVRGNRIQQWLNGQQTADIEIGSERWNQVMTNSKFRQVPMYASKQRGHIALQDHGDPVWYRNIRIRPLSGEG